MSDIYYVPKLEEDKLSGLRDRTLNQLGLDRVEAAEQARVNQLIEETIT